MVKKKAILALVLALTTASFADESLKDLADAGHWKRLHFYAEQRLKSNPNDAEATYYLARAKSAFADHNRAFELAQKAVALNGRNPLYMEYLGELQGRQAELAGVFSKFGWAKKAKASFEAAAGMDPKAVEPRFALMVYCLKAPGIAGGDKDRAAQLLKEIQAIDPTQGIFAQIRYADETKQPIDAEPLYLKIAQSDPKNYNIRISLAAYYSADARKKYDLSEKWAREALALDSTRIAAYNVLAAVYTFQKRWADLDRILAQSEKAVPDNLTPYYVAARSIIVGNEDPKRAEQYLRKYLTQPPEGNAPTHAGAHWRLGLALERQGRKPEAVGEIRTAVQMDPKLEPAQKDLRRLQ